MTAGHDHLAILTATIAGIVGLDTLNPDISLAELGVDSMKVVEIIMACEQIYEGAAGFEDLQIDQFTTIRGLHEQLEVLSGPGTARPQAA